MDTMRERFTDVTSRLLDEDPRLAVVLAVISSDRFKDARLAHPHRVIDVGIREQLLISVAGGMALTGMRPVVHTFASFLVERPFEQVKLDLSHQAAGAVLVSSGASYDISAGGRTHQAPGDIALLDTLDGWTIHVPGHPDEAEALIRHAAAADNQVYVRLSEQSNQTAQPVSPGHFRKLRDGRAGVVIAVGPLLDATLEAVKGMDLTVLYASTVRPFDAAGLQAAVSGTDATDVILIEPYLAGTSVPATNEALQALPHRILPIGTVRTELRHYGTWQEHVTAHGLDAANLRRQIHAFLSGA
ncbi:transketolase [Streptomyces sp. ME01-18a]|uniref:transketolase family protein n=1 Tax=Streptomyces sp. ME01-18a TaxID=3028669 RepID=UPI0029A40096|nr:transketolase [Streptomyces sp. ME01-18a]MDX3433916.1 transketolase [Streptomyces sp. ME01-18a]